MFPMALKTRVSSVGLLVAMATVSGWRVILAQQSSNVSESLTISRAVEIALRTNPLNRAADFGKQLAAAQLDEAKSGRLPSLVATGSFTRSNNPVFVFGSLLEQGRFGPPNFNINSLNHPDSLNNFRSSFTLRVPVVDQRHTETRVASGRIKQQQADQQSSLVEQQIRFEVIRSYYGLLLNEAKLNVANEAVKTAEADVKRARDMFDAGVVVHSDFLAAQVHLSELRQQQIQMEGELVTARAAFNTALGVPVNTHQRVSGELVSRSFNVDAVDALISNALQHRPDYQSAVLSSRGTSIELRRARGEWLPRVDAFVTAGASSEHLIGGSGDYAVGATVTFNIFDAGRKARIDQASVAESIATAEQEQLANQIRFEVVRAYQQYVSARERLQVAAETSAQASETLRIVQDRYQVGVTTITELLRAETALVRARSSLLAARYELYVGYATVLLTTGQLQDVDVFES